ncbi:hypothetical protein FRC03_001825 [Tulasnella sp. 419]|nr:hypothetical protein FRC03_001825 [Tulasnella sp. 419]
MLKHAVGLAILAKLAEAAVPLWGQCGGVNYTGETTCASPGVCVYSDQWYSQCRPGENTSLTVPTSTTSIVDACQNPSSKTTSTSTTTASNPAGTGFVKASGQKFTLDGKAFSLTGHNAYWLAHLSSSTDIDAAFKDIAKTGATTVRTWGFNEVTSPSGVYYQSWSGYSATVNTGSNGLAKFDTVISLAKANNLKLIVALTNNWADYGGMDVYVKQILNSDNHDLFYTDSSVKAAFKKYIAAWISRYKDEATILAWELANEPRCHGTTGTTSGSCTTSTITNWIKEISQYIKSIDSNHLVCIGDEGFGLSGSTSYPYTAYEGLDFATNLAISSVDFGTFHLYPEHWGTESQSDPVGWGKQWILHHAAIQKSQNKPVILEEYGVSSVNQYNTYNTWLSAVVSSGLTGDLIWQAGSTLPSGTTTHDDGYTIYPNDPVYPLLTSHNAALKSRDGSL